MGILTNEQYGANGGYASIELNGLEGDDLAAEFDGMGFSPAHWALAQPSGKRDPHDKLALVLAGGGIIGSVYEVGALRAIEDLLVGLTVNDFDIFVGTSAGALVNALIANGFKPREVMQLIDNRHPELHGFGVSDVFRLNIEDSLRRMASLPSVAWSIWRNALANFNDLALADLLWEMAQVLPTGIYNGDALERYVRATLEKPGFTNSFAKLDKQLFVVASELDSGLRAVFGRGHNADVPISLAVAASSAVPVIYRPVQIYEKDYLDGGLHGAASLDLAIEAGAKLVVCINPMVPFDASAVRPHEHYIRQRGLQAVVNQSVRTLLHASLRYHIKNLRVKYPDVDIILIQPGLDDYEMFSHNPMHYSGRLAVAQHGFETVTTGMLRNIEYYRSVLARHNVALHTDLLHAEMQRLHAGKGNEKATHLGIVDDLIVETNERSLPLLESLKHLERSLDRLRAYVERDGNGSAERSAVAANGTNDHATNGHATNGHKHGA